MSGFDKTRNESPPTDIVNAREPLIITLQKHKVLQDPTQGPSKQIWQGAESIQGIGQEEWRPVRRNNVVRAGTERSSRGRGFLDCLHVDLPHNGDGAYGTPRLIRNCPDTLEGPRRCGVRI